MNFGIDNIFFDLKKITTLHLNDHLNNHLDVYVVRMIYEICLLNIWNDIAQCANESFYERYVI